MQKIGENLVFAPSDLCRFMESPFVTWMDRVHVESPGRFQPDSDSDTNKLLQQRGIEHEREFLRTLKEAGRDVCDASTSENRFESTREAISMGREIIYQGALRDDEFIGYSDFLIKMDAACKTEPYHYEPWDTKLGLHAKPYYLVQLACYADLLANCQKELPKNIHLVLGNNEIKTFRTEDYLYYYRQVRRAFVEQQQRFNPDQPPDFSGLEEFGRWTTVAEQRIKELDHLSQVANIRRTQMRKLYSCGVHTMSQLAASQLGNVPGMKESTLATIRHQAQLQVASAGLLVPKFDILPNSDKGLENLPPSSTMDVFFDMEGYPFADGGLEYLFGSTTIEKSEMVFSDWWAHTPEEEKVAFESFIDWAYSRWLTDASMHIYHYASYEKTALRRLMGKYGTREQELDILLRNEVFVDLLPLVRQSIRVGQPNYSIKSIEQLYREKRHGEVATAIDSIVFYKKWLDERDGDDWRSSSVLSQIRLYNKEDCDSTYQLTAWLRKLQADHQIVFKGKNAKSSPQSDAAEVRNAAALLSRRMLIEIAVDANQRSERERLQVLLAHLLQFHWREAKPVFWAKYDRHSMTEYELFEDPCCLSGLSQNDTRPRFSNRSFLYDYSFDPDQDSKIDTDDNCFYAHNLDESIAIKSIDTRTGKITLKRSKEKSAPPDHLSLILDEFVDASAISESIYRLAQRFMNGDDLPPALEDFLCRRPPRIRNWVGGPILDAGRDLTEATIDVITRMENTTLCIQGPPGSGKTYTAANAIVQLLRLGKRVGVTANSHKAIAKLMDEVAKLIEDEISIRCVKIQSKDSDFEVTRRGISKLDPSTFFEKGRTSYSLIGGTAWVFSDARATRLCDYLFIDEAGQVSVANLVGMSCAAKNIVLIGDQMQLAQPLKGSHPGESGISVLQYFLQDQEVIAEDFGIFLGTSRRMHPEVCAFISGAIYQDRLHSHPETAERVLLLPDKQLQFVRKSAGLIYVPVVHDGNTQDSVEEADTIVEIIRELRQCSLTNKGASRPVEDKDILVVAPYNMQVRRLRVCLPDFQIGSVDRFQGQEAPIVIISMCTSSGEGLSRGIEFIFSRNRLNVAISRAQTLAVIVGSPALAAACCNTIEQLALVNLYCRILETSYIENGGKLD